jgi:hypothetical protein
MNSSLHDGMRTGQVMKTLQTLKSTLPLASVCITATGLIRITQHYFEGPRACLGKKFATTEVVCLLALLLRDWHVEPLLSVNVSTGEKETIEEWRARVMQAVMGITLGIKDVPLTFTRRL